MKTQHYFRTHLALLAMLVISSCSPKTFSITSDGENFDALTQITESEKPSMNPSGGDWNENLAFASLENDGYYNIYFKDNVLSNAVVQKTSGSNINLAPDFCKDKIAFQHYDKTNFDIYYINAFEGKAITQITYTDENEYNPSWSANGKILAFERGVPPKTFIRTSKNKVLRQLYSTSIKVTQNQIWLKNIESGELKMIGEGSFPVISPNGQEIAFVKYDLNKRKTKETGTIWIMSINGDSPKQLTNSQIGYATQPNWSPDGKKLAFQLIKDGKNDPDIYTIKTNGEDLTQLTKNESYDFAPYWSTNNQIYFSSDRGGKKGKYQIWRVKIR